MNQQFNIWIRFLFPFFLAIFLGTLIWMMAQFREPPEMRLYAALWFLGAIFMIWELGWWISRRLDHYFPWNKSIRTRLALQLLATNLASILLFLGSYIILNWYENQILGHQNPLGSLHIMVTLAESFIIVQITNSVQIGYQLLDNWQRVRLEAERLKKERVVNRLEQVRQQINPQFLSNHFNQLYQLIQETPAQLDSYLKELSDQFENRQAQLQSSLTQVQQSLQERHQQPLIPMPAAPKLQSNYRSRFMVRSGTRIFLIDTKDIAAFYKDDIVLLLHREGKKYPIDHSLEELRNMLSPRDFFRINRQCIIQAAYLGEMRPEGNQLQLSLSVPFSKTLMVSQRNVGAFKRWLNEG